MLSHLDINCIFIGIMLKCNIKAKIFIKHVAWLTCLLIALFVTFAAAQFHELLVHVIHRITIKRAHAIYQLHTAKKTAVEIMGVPLTNLIKL